MKCLGCGSVKVTEALAVEDDGTYPAGNHKVTTRHGRKWTFQASDSRIAARVCIDCGYAALFAEDPAGLAE